MNNNQKHKIAAHFIFLLGSAAGMFVLKTFPEYSLLYFTLYLIVVK